jgi:hypothetical protein
MNTEKLEILRDTIKKAEEMIKDLEKKRDKTVVSFIEVGTPIRHSTVYRLNKILRRIERKKELDLIVESGGGDLDSSAKMVKVIRNYFDKYSVIVPFFAKSAATFLALCADEIVLCKAGELGPIDPQVKHPAANIWIPAHSIKEAIDFIQETKDPLVKLALADKLDPWLIGAYKDAEKAARQYVEEIFEKLDEEEKEDHTHVFTGKYRSHGYPIDLIVCNKLNLKLNLKSLDEETENMIYDLHEMYMELLDALDPEDGVSILQSSNLYDVELDGENITTKIKEIT